MTETPEFRRVLILGTCVVGSIYAARLKLAGVDVALLARGRRLADLGEHGIVLMNRLTKELTVCRIALVNDLSSHDRYDLVLVMVRKNQVDTVLPALGRATEAATVGFLVNTASGFQDWSYAIGPSRLVLGFPGVACEREGIIIRYTIVPAWLQPTTFGEPNGGLTPRLQSIVSLFRRAGFPLAMSADMVSWLTTHVAIVSPLANAIYFVGGKAQALATNRSAIGLCVDAIREGFNAIRAVGLRVIPTKLRVLDLAPRSVVLRLLRAWAGTSHFEAVAGGHTLAAHAEMLQLAREFHDLAQRSEIATPSTDKLREACEAFEPGTGR
jgi:2-dehydropantoate 2-reductase